MGKKKKAKRPKKTANTETKSAGFWPEGVTFSSHNVYSDTIPKEVRLRYQPSAPIPSGLNPKVVIKRIVEPAHPAFGQYGLFAAQNIPKRALIIDYNGFICLDELASEDSRYLLQLIPATDDPTGFGAGFKRHVQEEPNGREEQDEQEPKASTAHTPGERHLSANCAFPELLVEAEKISNEARYMNDYHGTPAGAPNVRFKRRKDADTGEVTMGVYALKKKIRIGKELLVTYGEEFDLSLENDRMPDADPLDAELKGDPLDAEKLETTREKAADPLDAERLETREKAADPLDAEKLETAQGDPLAAEKEDDEHIEQVQGDVCADNEGEAPVAS